MPLEQPVGEIEQRLQERGIVLPAVFEHPAGPMPFDRVHVADDVVYIAGHVPIDGSRPLMQGKVGAGVSPQDGYESARLTALSVLASLKAELGDLDRISSWRKVLGFVNCAPGFNGMPHVINGFSDLILELWGDRGRHARSAIGVAELPFDVPTEGEAVVTLSR